MKQRMIEQPKKSTNKISMEGQLPYWTMTGYVQTVTENKKMRLDYVGFKVYRDDKNYCSFAVSIPHSLGIAVEIGDAVEVSGTIRTWWDENAGKTFIELYADEVKEWSE